MATDAFSEQRMPTQPLMLDPTRTAVIVVDMVNEFFEPGGKMVLAGGTALYAPVNALLDAAHKATIPVFYANQWLRPDDALFKKRIGKRIGGHRFSLRVLIYHLCLSALAGR